METTPTEITADMLSAQLGEDAAPLLLDVRTDVEWAGGHLQNAIHLPLDRIFAGDVSPCPDRSQSIVCYCAHGLRSLDAVRLLQKMGYAHVASLAGGIANWQSAGLPVETSGPLSAQEVERYRGHLALPEIGSAGQARLREAHVAVIGVGGLGSPAALYLAAAGIGQLTIIDDDTVSLGNLQRQILFSTEQVGASKVAMARARLVAMNPEITVDAVPHRLTETLAEARLARVDVILDGSDNFPTRDLLNRTAVRFNRPLVHGSVDRFEGQVTVFAPPVGPCYRCLFPTLPTGRDCGCAQRGVFGVAPGIIGSLQGAETLKMILGIGQPLIGRLLRVDLLTMSLREFALSKDPACLVCGSVRN
jgi:sulfur-carrier protein adenylyltransferase/sulfurtransferase